MQTRTIWKQKLAFTGQVGKHSVDLDAKSPLGHDEGFTPKELVVVGLSACTAMDVSSLMRKYRQPVETFEVGANFEQTEGAHPIVFKSVLLTFAFTGQLDKDKIIEAVHLSQTKYCGVSAMLSKAVPIRYRILLNGEEIGTGQASF